MKGSTGTSSRISIESDNNRIRILSELKTEWRSNPRDMNRIKRLQSLLNSKTKLNKKTWFL